MVGYTSFLDGPVESGIESGPCQRRLWPEAQQDGAELAAVLPREGEILSAGVTMCNSSLVTPAGQLSTCLLLS